MLGGWLRRRRPGNASADPCVPVECGGTGIAEYDGRSLDFGENARWHRGIPHPDWAIASQWLESFPDDRQAAAQLAGERAWLGWLCRPLGPAYRLVESETALLVTTQPQRIASLKLDYLRASRRRIDRLLDGLAAPERSKDILIACDDVDDYERYVSAFHGDADDFPMSSGVHLAAGRSHFVTNGAQLDLIEPVIVHEMTHASLVHLPIPAWLNEGLAVTVEQRLSPTPALYRPEEMLSRHRAFWTTERIQTFWAGASYLRDDEGNELSYDLGRILVAGLCADWPAFKRFVGAAHLDDAGAAAAAEHLDVDLGEFVRAWLDCESGDWSPDPSRWSQAPERGAFRLRYSG